MGEICSVMDGRNIERGANCMNQRISVYTPPHFDMVSYYDVVDFAVEVGLSKVEIYNTFELAQPDTAFAQKLRAFADERNV
jgi:hypothetical protein